MIEVNFVETNSSFKSKVYSAISIQLNKLLFRKRGAIVRDIRALIPVWVRSQPEMVELANRSGIGSLAAQFGLVYGTGPEAVDAIVNAITDSVALDITKVDKKTLRGGIKVRFMTATFAELLGIKEGFVRTEEGEDLHWLKWLLLDGFKAVVTGYHFQFKRAGRSGGGYMRKGGTWRVPPQFAGTEKDNFVTRALTGKKQEQDIAEVFKRHIR